MSAWLDAGEAAAELGVSPRTLERWTSEGRLVTRLRQDGRGRLYSRESVEARKAEMSPAARKAARKARRDAQNRAYNAAERRLREVHAEEFRELYAKACAEEGV